MTDSQSQRKIHFMGPTVTEHRDALPSFRLYNSHLMHRVFKHEHKPAHQCRMEKFKQREDTNQWPVFLLSFGVKETLASAAALNQKPSSPEQDEKIKAVMGSRGYAAGQLLFPRAVCLLPLNDDLVIADTENHRISVFNSSGVFKSTSEDPAEETEEGKEKTPSAASQMRLHSPRCVAGLPNNSIAVTDSEHHHVFIFQGNRIPRVRFVIPTEGLPIALACGINEQSSVWQLYVMTDKESIEGFSKTRKRVTHFALQHTLNGRRSPSGDLPSIAVDAKRRLLYISEPSLCRVFIYHLKKTGTGELAHSFPLLPCLSGLTMEPSGLAFLAETEELVVADRLNHTVNVYHGLTGQLLRCLLSPADKLGSVQNLALAVDGAFLAVVESSVTGKHQAKMFQLKQRPKEEEEDEKNPPT